MKLSLIILLFTAFTSITYAQVDKFNQLEDVYGFEVVFKKKLVLDKCDCCTDFGESRICELYKVEIRNVQVLTDSSVFNSASKLEQVEYIVINNSVIEDKNIIDKFFFAFGQNSCSDKLIVVNSLLEIIPVDISVNKFLPYISGLSKCKDFNLFQKFLLFLNINREKIYEKAKDLPPEASVFVQALKARN